jgi:hypothetical protein
MYILELLVFFACVVLCSPVEVGAARHTPTADGKKNSPARAKSATRATANVTSDTPTRFAVRNVNFHIDDTLVLEIREVQGTLASRVPGVPPTFDDKNSLLMYVDAGEAAMSTTAMSDLMNRYVFHYPGAPLSDIKISTESSLIKQEAIMHKGIAVPTEMRGTLAAMPDGRVRFRPITIKASGIPSTTLLDLLGIEVQDLIQTKTDHGVEIVGDDLLMDLSIMVPAPKMQVRVTEIWVEGDRIVQRFGPRSSVPAKCEAALRPADPQATNYMFYRGGTVSFGKLTMRDTDLQLVDADPTDPSDFFLDHYHDQLVAGYTKNLLDRGLLAIVPDYYRLRDGSTVARNPMPDLKEPSFLHKK